MEIILAKAVLYVGCTFISSLLGVIYADYIIQKRKNKKELNADDRGIYG